MKPPDLTHTTIRLRPFKEGDLARLHKLLSDERVYRAFGHESGPSVEEVTAQLPTMIAGYQSNGGKIDHMSAAIVDAASDGLIGLIGLDCVGDLGDVRIAVSSVARGRGRGKEALAGLLEWVAAETQLDVVLGVTKPDNEASAAMMLACGMEETFESAATDEGEEVDARTFQWTRPSTQ